MESTYSDKWLDAMKDELKSMEQIKLWDLVELLKVSKRVKCKWTWMAILNDINQDLLPMIILIKIVLTIKRLSH